MHVYIAFNSIKTFNTQKASNRLRKSRNPDQKRKTLTYKNNNDNNNNNNDLCFEREEWLRFVVFLIKLSLDICVRPYFVFECKIFAEHFPDE